MSAAWDCGRAAMGALVVLLAGLAAWSVDGDETWPARPIRWIVPYVPGGGTDITARLLAPRLGEALGQQIVVDNRPGAGGNFGSEMVVNAAPDGYTILFATVANSINETLYPQIGFSVLRDLAPVALLTKLPNVLEVTPALPITSVGALIAYGKAHP